MNKRSAIVTAGGLAASFMAAPRQSRSIGGSERPHQARYQRRPRSSRRRRSRGSGTARSWSTRRLAAARPPPGDRRGATGSGGRPPPDPRDHEEDRVREVALVLGVVSRTGPLRDRTVLSTGRRLLRHPCLLRGRSSWSRSVVRSGRWARRWSSSCVPSTGAKTAARLLRKVEAVFAEQDARFSRFRAKANCPG
jgi:hypothetical protein